MNYRRLCEDYVDDIVMEYGVSYDTARLVFLMWLLNMKRWESKCDFMIEYILGEE